MSTLFVVGLGIWLIGDGVRGLPGTGVTGAIAMVIGGILVLVTQFI